MRRRVILGAVACALASFLLENPRASFAAPGNPPPVQPGFHVALSGARPYADLPTAVLTVDLDGDGKQEVVLATRTLSGGAPGCNGRVYVYTASGALRWEANIPSPPGMGPAASDLNGDGTQDIVVGYGSLFTGCQTGGGVFALNGQNGATLWN